MDEPGAKGLREYVDGLSFPVGGCILAICDVSSCGATDPKRIREVESNKALDPIGSRDGVAGPLQR